MRRSSQLLICSCRNESTINGNRKAAHNNLALDLGIGGPKKLPTAYHFSTLRHLQTIAAVFTAVSTTTPPPFILLQTWIFS